MLGSQQQGQPCCPFKTNFVYLISYLLVTYDIPSDLWDSKKNKEILGWSYVQSS